MNDLNNRGIQTNKGRPFNKNSLHRMLKNPKYYGLEWIKTLVNTMKERENILIIEKFITLKNEFEMVACL